MSGAQDVVPQTQEEALDATLVAKVGTAGRISIVKMQQPIATCLRFMHMM